MTKCSSNECLNLSLLSSRTFEDSVTEHHRSTRLDSDADSNFLFFARNQSSQSCFESHVLIFLRCKTWMCQFRYRLWLISTKFHSSPAATDTPSLAKRLKISIFAHRIYAKKDKGKWKYQTSYDTTWDAPAHTRQWIKWQSVTRPLECGAAYTVTCNKYLIETPFCQLTQRN